jgi:CRP-like cAMP-binding protein
MKCYCEQQTTRNMRVSEQCFRELWLFEDLNEAENRCCLEFGTSRMFQPGQTVFHQGDPADALFIIKAGRIKLSKVLADGKEIILDFRTAGDMIGENMIAEDCNYPVTAWSMEDTMTCGFTKSNFETLVRENPQIGIRVIKNMGKRIAFLTSRLESMSMGSVSDRLYRVLSNIAFEHGVEGNEGYHVSFPLTHEELSFLVGVHRVTITRAMKELTLSGKVAVSDRGIFLRSQVAENPSLGSKD